MARNWLTFFLVETLHKHILCDFFLLVNVSLYFMKSMPLCFLGSTQYLHPDTRSLKLVSARFVCSNRRQGIANWIRIRNDCQISKVHQHFRAQLATFPYYRCSIVAYTYSYTKIDACESGYRRLITCIDI